MRPVIKGDVPQENGLDIVFNEYSHARRYLIDRIGEYCSYCERKIEVNLAIEHVLPKSLVPSEELKWSNFLFACTNCNSTKSDKPITLTDYVWPDFDNTYEYFVYVASGLVAARSVPDTTLSQKIKAMIALVGLDSPAPKFGTVDWKKASDRRVEHRGAALIQSEKSRLDYTSADQNARKVMLDLISYIAINQGFWSIWMKAFEAFPEVQRRLIDDYTGTNKSYFSHVK